KTMRTIKYVPGLGWVEVVRTHNETSIVYTRRFRSGRRARIIDRSERACGIQKAVSRSIRQNVGAHNLPEIIDVGRAGLCSTGKIDRAIRKTIGPRCRL